MTHTLERAGHDSLVVELEAIVGARHVRRTTPERVTYATDGLPTHRRLPRLVVLPGTRDEVITVVRVLARRGVPFVPRGAGTGLSGGALADDAVLLGLTRLTRILTIDAVNRRAVVEPGVVNVRLTAAVAPHGLHYAPDPSSQAACTIGGNVAENAGGPHCLKYGVTLNHVAGAHGRAPDGRSSRWAAPRASPGAMTCAACSWAARGASGSRPTSGCACSRSPRRCARCSPTSPRSGPTPRAPSRRSSPPASCRRRSR